MKEIQLTQGKVALVDNEDFEWLSAWKWRYSNGYAVRTGSRLLGGKTIYMHREIMKTPADMFCDHKNIKQTLDNQKSNLRNCTPSQNNANTNHRVSASGYKGVHRNGKNWCAQLYKDKKKVLCKTFKTPEEAAKEYDKAAKEHFGEFAVLNFS